jgi:zinc transport system permease protein
MLDDFLLRSLLGGLGVAVLAAPLGCFMVWRRMAYFGETISYGGLLGLAFGFALRADLTASVVIAALAIAALLTALGRQKLLPTDTLLGVIAHSALAFGLIIASVTAGAKVDLMSYLFGDILAVSKRDLIWIGTGVAVVWGTMVWLWRPLLAISVHEELAAAEGAPAGALNLAFMLLLAVAVALGMKIVGVVLITSLLVIPAATARAFSTTPEQMAFGAGLIGTASVMGGLESSLWFDTPAGPSIIAALSLLFAASLAIMAGRRWRKQSTHDAHA